jgi:hypothetical protein
MLKNNPLKISSFFLLLAYYFFLLSLPGAAKPVSEINCKAKIQQFANAAALWQNAHKAFPSEAELKSAAFKKLLQAVGASDTSFCCPATGKPYLYTYSRDNYKIACPNPEVHKLSALYFSLANGLVEQKLKIVKRSKVSPEDKQGMLKAIKELYQAYKKRDLEKVMLLEKEAIEASALDYQARGKGPAQEVRDAFRGATQDLFSSPDFDMQPLLLEEVKFYKENDIYVASSVVPILASYRVELISKPVKIRIGELKFKKTPAGFKIIQMTMY